MSVKWVFKHIASYPNFSKIITTADEKSWPLNHLNIVFHFENASLVKVWNFPFRRELYRHTQQSDTLNSRGNFSPLPRWNDWRSSFSISFFSIWIRLSRLDYPSKYVRYIHLPLFIRIRSWMCSFIKALHSFFYWIKSTI